MTKHFPDDVLKQGYDTTVTEDKGMKAQQLYYTAWKRVLRPTCWNAITVSDQELDLARGLRNKWLCSLHYPICGMLIHEDACNSSPSIRHPQGSLIRYGYWPICYRIAFHGSDPRLLLLPCCTKVHHYYSCLFQVRSEDRDWWEINFAA